MALETSRFLFVLLVISAATVLFILSWGHFSESISWTAVLGNSRHRGEDSLFVSDTKLRDEKGSTTPLSAVFTETNPAATLKIRASTHAAVAETPMPVLSVKSFKKLPLWDFEGVYNQDAPPRDSTCAQSLQNSEDESFREAFLPNIRLFLHKDNINMSEWNRLSHFHYPFGFMGYKYDDVMASVKLIPKPQEPLLHPKPGSDGCIRCAVVGTAGILNGSKMGKEIDAHDYVFRMNGAIIKGHEEDVGSRTSVYVHSARSMTASLYLFKKYGFTSAPHDEGIKFVMIPEGMTDFNWLEGLLKGERISAGPYHNKRPRTYYGGQYNESRYYVLHQDFLRYVRNRFLKSANLNSYWAIVRPTSGAFTVLLALHTCDTVNAYGFMTEDYKKYSTYYFENTKTNVVFYINHDYILEKNLWKKLHNGKVIRLFQRTNSEKGTEKPK
ncbi:alpha-N-acetylgalactosaminide alpha-2,6-sialyltransferase 1-like [Chelmon rostratus]|uniref:alpha-N-acetylgalactosaminide alpha-2,6-sialyltransferase 1-like n=1 Tax=Chelmon rostratus TaxID=109905 RepID=UPI001BE98B5B|nr:alpha-N-acetylgalactosaminide alpha-2,6-sialyltransferase 1-like [Chelmon rostratus]